jgi:hypothetical protein
LLPAATPPDGNSAGAVSQVDAGENEHIVFFKGAVAWLS